MQAKPIYYLTSAGVILTCVSIILLFNTHQGIEKIGYTILTQTTSIAGFSSLALIFFGAIFNSLKKIHAPYRMTGITEEDLKKVSKIFPNPDKELSRVITKNNHPVAYILFNRTENLVFASPKLVDAEFNDVGGIIRDTLFDTASYLGEDIVINTKQKEIFRKMGFISYKTPNVLIAPCPETIEKILKSRFEKGFKTQLKIMRKKNVSKKEALSSKSRMASIIHSENKQLLKIMYKEMVYKNAFEGIIKSRTKDIFYDKIKTLTETSFNSYYNIYFK
ncbi:MAG: hypothetical protein PHW96_02675 [Candidatus Nanoarchaeia archaeon]|nr:hypothetical protein [Candidatus Nanoarchaeia archaeon]